MRLTTIAFLAFLSAPAHAGGVECEGWLDEMIAEFAKMVSDWDWITYPDYPGLPWPSPDPEPEDPEDPDGGDEGEE